ncbi:MAG TPA: NUDIX domain-containing protein [Candidatus Binatia bacterium]|jgi:predicted NUDIX family NTP pyrophosphohydrolase
MAKESAGIVLYRYHDSTLEIFLVHPGGPFWKNKDSGAWSIPKGEFDKREDPLRAARREFHEETGCSVDGSFIALTPVRQAGGKMVHAWAVEGDCEAESIRSNSFTIEWPPRSGQRKDFSEVDRAGWFSLELAREKILKGQLMLLDELEQILKGA